jgi:hypothetical protein
MMIPQVNIIIPSPEMPSPVALSNHLHNHHTTQFVICRAGGYIAKCKVLNEGAKAQINMRP